MLTKKYGNLLKPDASVVTFTFLEYSWCLVCWIILISFVLLVWVSRVICFFAWYELRVVRIVDTQLSLNNSDIPPPSPPSLLSFSFCFCYTQVQLFWILSVSLSIIISWTQVCKQHWSWVIDVSGVYSVDFSENLSFIFDCFIRFRILAFHGCPNFRKPGKVGE